jgi:hypothetical protein
MQGSDAIQLTPVDPGLSGCVEVQLGIPELRWPGSLGHEHHSPQDAQKFQTFYPLRLGAPRRVLSQVYIAFKTARLSPPLRASNEGLLRPRVARAQGTHRVILSLLADFFSILL